MENYLCGARARERGGGRCDIMIVIFVHGDAF